MTIVAKVVSDSINEYDHRLTTFQLRYPRFIHAEFMTHRLFSRNASSSRAVPVAKLIEDIQADTAMPIYWGKNQPGMQAGEECDAFVNHGIPLLREDAWIAARNYAIEMALAYTEAGYHKQIVNRLLEPFSHINVVCTATEYSNFFALRRHKDAQPEIHALADEMFSAIEDSTPRLLKYGEWHLPYITSKDVFEMHNQDTTIKCSVARCARVSYLTHDMKVPSIPSDLALYDRLVGSQPIHASPAEHQATPDRSPVYKDEWDRPHLHGNFKGWKQYRKSIIGECQ